MKRCFFTFAYASFITLLFLVMGLDNVTAQYENLPAIGNGAISLELSTLYPRPNQTINATVSSFSTDLSRATITWYINGKSVATGRGLTRHSITTSGLGIGQTISVTAVTPEGIDYEASQTLRAAEVDLIWQADSYVPPFYKGKALYPYQGRVTIAAIPRFSETPVNPKNFIYKWKVNGSAYDNVSGYGSDSIVVTGTVVTKPITVVVTVTNLDGTISAYDQVTITSRGPEIVFYEDSQLYGPLYNRALTDFELKNKEIMLRAVPYYFSVSEPHTAANVEYDWKINNDRVSVQNNGTENLLLRKPENANGRSLISLDIKNPFQILQFGNARSTIYFTTQ